MTDVQKSMMLKYIVKQFLSTPLILGNIKDTAFYPAKELKIEINSSKLKPTIIQKDS